MSLCFIDTYAGSKHSVYRVLVTSGDYRKFCQLLVAPKNCKTLVSRACLLILQYYSSNILEYYSIAVLQGLSVTRSVGLVLVDIDFLLGWWAELQLSSSQSK